MPEDNKTLVRRVFEEVWNQRKLEVADQLLASDYVSHDPASPDFGRGPDALKRLVKYYTDAFPDTHFTVDEMISEGDRVVARWTVTGTQRGQLGDIPATNRQVTVTGVEIVRISNGKVQEARTTWDALGLMRQLGAVQTIARGA